MTEHVATAQPPAGGVDSPAATSRPRFSVREAAEACGVHPDSIRRRLKDLKEHGADKDESGAWSIPVEALLALGLKPGRPAPPDAPSTTSPSTMRTTDVAAGDSVADAEIRALRDEVAALKHRLELEQVRRETAERLIDVHRDALDEARAWRRILEAGPSSQASVAPASVRSESMASESQRPQALPSQPQHRGATSRFQGVVAALRGR